MKNLNFYKVEIFIINTLINAATKPLFYWGMGGYGKKPSSLGHWNITDEVLNEKPFKNAFSEKAKKILKCRSRHLDITFLGLIDGLGFLTKLYRLKSQLPNHWESTPKENNQRLNKFLNRAIELANEGKIKASLMKLGDAYHIGQDKGAHENDHKNFKNGNPDNPLDNPNGWIEAKNQTVKITKAFLNALYKSSLEKLKNY